MARRGKFEYITDVLEACKKETSITAIVLHQGINMTTLKPLINLLCQEGYVNCYPARPKMPPCRRKNRVFTRKCYRITEKGRDLLKASSPLVELTNKLCSVNGI